MVKSSGARSTRRRARASERGAAVFVVLLVIVMLTGIGVFATRAAALATQASGFERQMTQTHYVTEYGVLTATAELSTARREAYVKAMTNQLPTSDVMKNCKSVLDTSKSPAVPYTNATCYRFGYMDLEKLMLTANNNVLVEPFKPGPPAFGGGLGFAPIEADFMIEMTDLGPATPPVAGTDLTSAGAVNVQYVGVTLNATGQVRPLTANQNLVDPVRAKSASIENSRAHVIVGPLPKL